MKLQEVKNQFTEGQMSKPDYINKMHQVHSVLFDYADWLKNNDVSKIEIVDGEVLMTTQYRGVDYASGAPVFLCDRQDQRIAPIEILNFGHYENNEFQMMNKLIAKSGNILDIGANIGFYSVHLAKANSQVKIFSFEPLPKTFSYLKKHIELNKCTSVTINNFGFSDKEGEFDYFYYGSGSGNASLANLSGQKDVLQIKCKVKTLDSYIQDSKLKVDFIKCDVEGAELFVFRGGLETIRRDRPIVFTEILRKWSRQFNYDPNEIFKLFAELDYKAYFVKDEKLIAFSKMDENTVETNFFFVPKEKNINGLIGSK